MGLSTLAWRVSRRPEYQRTSFNKPIHRRFFSLASRHCTSVFFFFFFVFFFLFFFSCRTQISPSVCINGPLPRNGILNLSCASERGTEIWTRAYNLPVPRRFSCLTTKCTQECFWGFFSMQKGGVGLKNGVPYLQMGLSTLVSHVSRRPEEERTSFNLSINRRFFSLVSRHRTSVFLHAESKLTHPSA